MPVRFQVDGDFYDHPKAIGLSDPATALWVRAGSYSANKLTDGFIAEHVLALLSSSPEDASRELVERGLWRRVKGGYKFHQWDKRNLTRARVEAEKSSDRQRKRRSRGTKGQNANPQVKSTNVRPDSEPESGGNPPGFRDLSVSVSESVSMSVSGPPSTSAEGGQTTPPGDPDGFAEFWERYPRKVSRKAAVKAYRTALKDTDAQTLNNAASVYAASVRGKDQKFIPHPTTWLNQGRWDDTPETPTGGQHDDVPAYWRRPTA